MVATAQTARLVTTNANEVVTYAASPRTIEAIAEVIGTSRELSDSEMLVELLRMIDQHFVDEGEAIDVVAAVASREQIAPETFTAGWSAVAASAPADAPGPDAARLVPMVAAERVVNLLRQGRRDFGWCGTARRAAEDMNIDYNSPTGEVPKERVRRVALNYIRDYGYADTIRGYLRQLDIDPDLTLPLLVN